MSQFSESNRWKHFLLGIPSAFLLTILFTLGCATGLEVKDCQSDPNNFNKPIYKWSWKNFDIYDWLWTFYGGLIGQILQILLIIAIK